MIFKKTIASSTVAFIGVGAALIVACSDKAEDTSGGGGGGGTAGTATGGSATGGASGTAPTGGTATGGTATGGTATGGAGGAGAVGGAGGAGGNGGGAAAMGPYACDTPKLANCGAINDFSTSTMQSWGSGDFSGGVSVFGAGIMRDNTDTMKIHVTGMVAGYGHGFVLWFTACSSLAAYDGITFTVSGTSGDTVMADTIDFQLQTNADYPWQAAPADGKGFCTAVDAANPFGTCIAPSINVPLATTPNVFTWTQMMGGMPTPWSATMSPAQLIGIQWQFPWTPTRTAYAVDVTLDNVQFTGGTGPTTACPAYMAGMGGMGGMAGAGGAAAGMAGTTGGGRGGMGGAGAGGMAGMAGTTGGGRGGMAGMAGGT